MKRLLTMLVFLFVSLLYADFSAHEQTSISQAAEHSTVDPAPGFVTTELQEAGDEPRSDVTQSEFRTTVPEPLNFGGHGGSHDGDVIHPEPVSPELPGLSNHSGETDAFYPDPVPFEHEHLMATGPWMPYVLPEHDPGPIVLPSIDNETQWQDILPNITSLVTRLCGSEYLCDAPTSAGDMRYSKCTQCHNCQCDSLCYVRGDCCLDKLLGDAKDHLIINVTSQTLSSRPRQNFGCYSTSFKSQLPWMPYFFIDSCPEDFSDTHVQNECHKALSTNGSVSVLEELRSVWPVWSSSSDFLYRNKFCALCCGEDDQALRDWTLEVVCHGNTQLFNTGTFEALIDTCNATGRRATYHPLLWHGCQNAGLRSSITFLNVTYRNLFCALCNQAEEERRVEFECYGKNSATPFPLVLVMSVDVLSQVPGSRSTAEDRYWCREDEVYDPFENRQCVTQFSDFFGVPYVLCVRFLPYNTTEDIVLSSISALHDVVWTVMGSVHEKLAPIVGSVQTERLILIARIQNTYKESSNQTTGVSGADANRTVNEEEAVHVQSFLMKVFFRTIWDQATHSNISEQQLVEMTYGVWNLSVNHGAGQEFRATPHYFPVHSVADEFSEPTLLTSHDASLDYVVGYGLIHRDQHYFPVQDTLLCAKVLTDLTNDSLSSSSFSLNTDTGSLLHRPSGTTVSFQYVELLQNGKVMVCADQIYSSLAASPTLALPENLFSPSVITVSVVCQSLSVVSLFLVLCTYCLFPELRTLPGKNTLALVVTLLLAMLTFQLGVARVELPTACLVLGVLIHYLLLSSFTWMMVCSFHMYRIFTHLLHHAHTHRADQDRSTLARYVMVATAVPALVVCLTLLVNYLAHRHRCSLDLGYGVGVCYLSNRWSLLLASVLPISLVMLVNLVLFICTVVALRSFSVNRRRLVRQPHRQLLVYIRMSTVTGINWLVGLAAVHVRVDSPVMWHVFSVLCGLQGVYVFVAFICNERVYRLFRHSLYRAASGAADSGLFEEMSGVATITERQLSTRRDRDPHPLPNSVHHLPAVVSHVDDPPSD
ncbi:uncharacterized protein LOC143292224 [Babylonia areolata]|uniref:uncharacterized protein LOC143292224 n=1 Tax=Babylonia areolata TaxID=304850 RepID=UPI003FD67C6D